MKNLFATTCFLVATNFFIQNCANISSPNGGPKDTIPPVLINSIPLNGTVNFTNTEFKFEFSEFVNADKIQQQLIITPKTESKYKTTVKKNTLIIKFDGIFQDSTTFNFNFADGITDITENNPVVNLSLAFSTGSYIDSLNISGEIIDLFEQEEVDAYLVGLYPYTDTLDYFTQNPLYFTTSRDSGLFSINYIKKGLYKLIVFNDDNRNILLDPETEAHGFVVDSISLDSSIFIEKPIPTLLQNVKPITYINTRPTGPYIEIKYSKTISKYEIHPHYFYHNLIGENKDVIRIYKSEKTNIGDSIKIISTVFDSLSNSSIDTIKTAFVQSNRKPSAFSYKVETSQRSLENNQRFNVTFSKPVSFIDSTMFLISKDSSYKFQLTPKFTWNDNKTKLNIESNILAKHIVDTIRSLTIKNDSTFSENRNSEQLTSSKTKLPSVEFITETGAFISVENDTSKSQSLNIELEEPQSYGSIKFSLETSYQSFKLQLLDSNNEPAYYHWSSKKITFSKVKPGKYTIRILIDNNLDGIWSPGNLLQDIPPEDIYLHPDETSIRENWVLEIDISF
ncbi:MAG: Ig-like domain-containing protein [Bacteroidota bacterium]